MADVSIEAYKQVLAAQLDINLKVAAMNVTLSRQNEALKADNAALRAEVDALRANVPPPLQQIEDLVARMPGAEAHGAAERARD